MCLLWHYKFRKLGFYYIPLRMGLNIYFLPDLYILLLCIWIWAWKWLYMYCKTSYRTAPKIIDKRGFLVKNNTQLTEYIMHGVASLVSWTLKQILPKNLIFGYKAIYKHTLTDAKWLHFHIITSGLPVKIPG